MKVGYKKMKKYSIYTTVKGYLKFNLKGDVMLESKQRSFNYKKYTLEQQRKQCEKAFKELLKQESKGLIIDLTYTENPDGSVIMTWERVS